MDLLWYMEKDGRQRRSFSVCLLVSVVTPFRLSDMSNPIGRTGGPQAGTQSGSNFPVKDILFIDYSIQENVSPG